MFPADHVKYLGLNLDKFLNWDHHIKLLSNKLSRANGVLSKLRHYAPKNILLNVYHSIFYSHMIYACPVWSLTKKMNIESITVLQKKCLRIINFAPFNSHTNDMFVNDKILKFVDIISIEQLKIIFNFLNSNLPDELMKLFHLNMEVSNCNTRNASNQGLFIPQIHTVNHGNLSLKYSGTVLWNAFIKSDSSIVSYTQIGPFKSFKFFFYLSLYECI